MSKVKIAGHASGSGTLTIQAPDTSSSRTITLPDATGTLLNSDGSGASLTGLTASQMPTGSVIQVVQNALNPSSYTTTSTSWAAITDMDVTITPTATSSKVLVTFNCGGAIIAAETNQNAIYIRMKRDTTVIRSLNRYGYNRNDDYSSMPIFFTYLDSPSTTSATTYTIEMMSDTGSMFINRDSTTNGGVTIAQEIAG